MHEWLDDLHKLFNPEPGHRAPSEFYPAPPAAGEAAALPHQVRGRVYERCVSDYSDSRITLLVKRAAGASRDEHHDFHHPCGCVGVGSLDLLVYWMLLLLQVLLFQEERRDQGRGCRCPHTSLSRRNTWRMRL